MKMMKSGKILQSTKYLAERIYIKTETHYFKYIMGSLLARLNWQGPNIVYISAHASYKQAKIRIEANNRHY